MPINNIIIVGAGPSGLLLGILLAKNCPDIQITVFEKTFSLDNQPRAAHYASCAAYELDRAGVLDDIKARGIHPDGVAWRKIDGTLIAGAKPSEDALPRDYRYRMVCLPLDRLDPLLYDHLVAYPNAKVKFGHQAVGLGQDEGKAWVDVEVKEEEEEEEEEDTCMEKIKEEADYVIGCDGASSTIRRLLFGPEYPGETLKAQIIATNVYYDFTKFSYWDSNFIVHPTNWYMAARIAADGLYRVTYGDTPGLSREEYIARQPMRYEEILPGHPKPEEYKIVNIGPYKLQQRCAPSFRVGRVLLAADAAHLCNPFGGLGLTGGIADVGSLYDALKGIHLGLADEDILDKYSEVRRKIWKEIIDPMSRENFRRLHDQDPDKARENDEFFKLCIRAENDLELQKQMALGSDILTHDFTQYWKKRPTENGV